MGVAQRRRFTPGECISGPEGTRTPMAGPLATWRTKEQRLSSRPGAHGLPERSGVAGKIVKPLGYSGLATSVVELHY